MKPLGRIVFTSQVVFKDMHGIVLRTYNIGDSIDYTAIVDNFYYVTSMGGIYLTEAKITDE